MTVRGLAKRAALLLPPVRRLYDYALAEAKRATALQIDHDRSVAHAEDLRMRLQSDYERSLAHAEDLRMRLQQAELRRDQAEWLAESEARLRADLETKLTEREATAEHIDYLHTRLVGNISILSAELTDLRRLIHSERSNGGGKENARLRTIYLDLLESAVSGRLYDDPSVTPGAVGKLDPREHMIGRDGPSQAPTMIRTAGLRNIRVLGESILEDAVEGDFLEAGVWRGSACIYMRGLLAAHGVKDRTVFAADSFVGLPRPQPELYPADKCDQHYTQPELAVSLDEVKANFAKFGLLDDQVVFLPGWFKDTLPVAPVRRLALLRLDCDMYGSTFETLTNLYPKVSAGGYIIINDYVLRPCRKAVADFRGAYGCSETLHDTDSAAVFWRKET
jgi:hypothetical protein